jgi:molybdopterin-guanine dinucleotide biosynthesis protein A
MREGLPSVGGYVLAGGKSSRMGKDKALLELGGKPLLQHASTKLRRVCAEVSILGNDSALERFGALVRDLHPGSGPMAGIEAALLNSRHEWNVVLPVDVPFLPTALLDSWLWSVLHDPTRNIKLSMMSFGGRLHPALLIVHREIATYLTDSLERGELKLLPALRSACDAIAAKLQVGSDEVFAEMRSDEFPAPMMKAGNEGWRTLTEAQRENRSLWFANLNTPEDFAEAERHVNALDT